MQDGRQILATPSIVEGFTNLQEPELFWFDLRLGAETTPDGPQPARWLRRSAPTALDARRQVLVAGDGCRILEIRRVQSAWAPHMGRDLEPEMVEAPEPRGVPVPLGEWGPTPGGGWYSEMEISELNARLESPQPGDHSLIGGLLSVEGTPWRYYWEEFGLVMEAIGAEDSDPIQVPAGTRRGMGYLYVVGPNGPIHRQ